MRKKVLIICFVIIFAILTLIVNTRSISTNSFVDNSKDIIIDAGHGYPDGGAVAADGTVESELNLQVSLLLEEKLSKLGFNCILTRNSQEGVYTEGDSIHAKKVSDIRNRVAIANKNKDALLVSIHMNTYPSRSVRGIQVFYKSDIGLSKQIAFECQNAINLILQNDNHKTVKKVSPSIYLFKNIKNEALLIECGFITNEQDLQLLKDEKYRSKLANTIAETIAYKLNGSD